MGVPQLTRAKQHDVSKDRQGWLKLTRFSLQPYSLLLLAKPDFRLLTPEDHAYSKASLAFLARLLPVMRLSRRNIPLGTPLTGNRCAWLLLARSR